MKSGKSSDWRFRVLPYVAENVVETMIESVFVDRHRRSGVFEIEIARSFFPIGDIWSLSMVKESIPFFFGR